MKRARVVAGLLLVASLCLEQPFGASARPVAAAPPALTALDIIELEVSFTTLLARYYKPLTPQLIAEGARSGVTAELLARHVDATLPFVPSHVDFASAADLIDGYVLRSLARYGRRVDGPALVRAAVAGELARLHDPYTVLFRPQAFAKFNAFLGNGSFGGIGAIVSLDSQAGRAPVERALPDSPAARAGLGPGDAVVAIDGRPVAALPNAQALLGALRGRIGTRVALDLVRADGSTAHVVLERAAVRDPEVTQRRFGGVAYVRLARFGDRAGAEVASVVAAEQQRGACALVLDLRGNGGGYGDEATSVASVFIPSGPIFTTRERTGAPVTSVATGRAVARVPLAVLVDGDTASAAEIVAGAVQDDGVGTLVGQRTFGKGVVQSVFALPDGSAIKMTTARYTTPKGRDIDRVGIVPDVVVANPPGARLGDPMTDAQLAASLHALVSAGRVAAACYTEGS